MSQFNAHSYRKLTAGVTVFQNMIRPLNLSDRQVVEANPLEFRTALAAASAVALCSRPLLSLVIFGQTLKGCTSHSSGRYGCGPFFEGRGSIVRFGAYADPVALVAATCGECPEAASSGVDLTANLFR